MLIYRSVGTEPYMNMAVEEHLINICRDEDIFMLWQNEAAVIIGINQNAYSEVNRTFAEQNGIKVVRRLTGGGAVFHDLGNLNYTFVTSDCESGKLNFGKFCEPIITALNGLGLNAELSGRNDITVDGLKVSGTAQCMRSGKVMHHGTLLWSADLTRMKGVLNPNVDKLSSKGIKSVKSRVGNISSMLSKRSALPECQKKACLDGKSSVIDFRDYLESFYPDAELKTFTQTDIEEIKRLCDEKYSCWEWNYGRSGKFVLSSKKHFDFGEVEIGISCEKGRIKNIGFMGDFFGYGEIEEICKRLEGVRLLHDDLISALSGIDRYIYGATPELIANLISECC